AATMIAHATQFRLADRTFDGMDITAAYKLEKTEMGLRLTRLGELKINPPGYKAGDRLTASHRATRAILDRLLGDVFQEVMELDEIPIPRMLQNIGNLLPIQAQTSNGWLILGVRRPD